MVSPPTPQRNASRGQGEGRAGKARKKRGQGHYKGRGVLAPRPGVLTKELQWHNDQHEEHHYDYHRGKRFPAHYAPPSLRTPSLVVGYLDNQLKGRSPAKLGPRSVLLMGALLLTPCFLALPLAVLPLLLPDLLAFLSLLRLLPPLVLRFVRILLLLLLVGSVISLRWVPFTIHAVLRLVGFCTFAL